MDTGLLLLDRHYAPYVTGCVLPYPVLSAALEATAQPGKRALELRITMETATGKSQITLLFAKAEEKHRDFLHGVKEAAALYLLTGPEHPKSLYQRMHEGGAAVEVTEPVRRALEVYLSVVDPLPEAVSL